MRVTLVGVLLFSVVSCSGDSGPNAGESACQKLEAKLADCHLTVQGACNSNAACAVECAANADCGQLAASAPMGSYLTCIAACSGAGPDDFICKDGKGFVNKAGVCDGKPQCPDGSDEAACGVTDAGTGGASPGAGGAGAGPTNDGGVPDASPECQAMVAHELAACPNLSRDSELRNCVFDTLLYAPEGCGSAWNAYLQCLAQVPWDCTTAPTGCDQEQSGYFSCQSRFTSTTGCSRSRSTDSRCAAGSYGYNCIGTIPGSCLQLPPTGGAAQFCCPQFSPP